jgi:REP element-mobilizing transposase RayT
MESCTQVFVHLVWSTRHRLPLITEDIEPRLRRILVAKATQLRCAVLAVGGTADHVHVAVRLHSTASIAVLAQEMKGASSFRVGQSQAGPSPRLRWQGGYGAFSFAARDAERVIAYVNGQREHHAAMADRRRRTFPTPDPGPAPPASADEPAEPAERA